MQIKESIEFMCKQHNSGVNCILCLFLIFVFLLSGCETTRLYDFHVNSVSSGQTGNIEQQSFIIVDVHSTVPQSMFHLREAKETVSTALTGLGMYESDSPENADILVYIAYGMAGPLHVAKPKSNLKVVPVAYSGKQYPQTGPDPDESPIPPNYVIKDQKVYKSELQAPKFLRITALKNLPADDLFLGKKPEQVWSVFIKNTNLDMNLRTYILIMSAVAMKYIDTETDNFIWMYLYSNDPDVKFIRQTLRELRDQ